MFELSSAGGVARLRLARPEARNAIPGPGWGRLREVIERIERSGERLLLLSGSAEAFCAGADLADFPGLIDDAEAVARFRIAMREALDRLRDLSLVTIALIDGPCFGAGVALAMACDLRIAGAGARFAITPAKLGIAYPQEDVARLVALVGPGQSSRLLFAAEAIDAVEAQRIGLVETVASDCEAAATAWIEAVTANSGESVSLLKRAIRLAESGTASDDAQNRSFDALFAGTELRARLAALRPSR